MPGDSVRMGVSENVSQTLLADESSARVEFDRALVTAVTSEVFDRLKLGPDPEEMDGESIGREAPPPRRASEFCFAAKIRSTTISLARCPEMPNWSDG